MGNVSPAACYPCEAGDVVSMSTVLFGGLQLDRPALIDGSPFEGTVGASFEFLSPSIVVPSAAANFTVRQMFTFSATVTGEIDQNTVFSRLLNGQGLLTANFAHNPNIADVTAFEFSDIRYDFTEPAPVPSARSERTTGPSIALARSMVRGSRPWATQITSPASSVIPSPGVTSRDSSWPSRFDVHASFAASRDVAPFDVGPLDGQPLPEEAWRVEADKLVIGSVPGARPIPRSIRPGYSVSRVPNCSAITSGAWFGSMMPPAPTRRFRRTSTSSGLRGRFLRSRRQPRTATPWPCRIADWSWPA